MILAVSSWSGCSLHLMSFIARKILVLSWRGRACCSPPSWWAPTTPPSPQPPSPAPSSRQCTEFVKQQMFKNCCFTNSVHCLELFAGDSGWGDGVVIGTHYLRGEQHAQPRQLRTKIFLAMKLCWLKDFWCMVYYFLLIRSIASDNLINLNKPPSSAPKSQQCLEFRLEMFCSWSKCSKIRSQFLIMVYYFFLCMI